MRATQARSSSSERALASENIGCGWRDLLEPRDRLGADALGRRVGRDELGVLGLDRAQLVEQRVVDVVADLGVVEHVVAVVVVRRAARRSSAARGRHVAAHSTSSRRRREQAREVVAPAASRCPGWSVRSKCSGVTAIRPLGDRRQVGALLVVVVGRVAVDAVLLAAGLLVDQRQLVAVDALAEPRDLDALDVAGRHVDVEQRALRAAARPRSRPTMRAVNAAAASKSKRSPRRKSISRARDCWETAIAREAEHDALERRGDRAGVGDVVAQVGAVVDAGDDQVGLEALDQPQRGEAHAVDRRAVASRSRPCRRRTRPPRPTAGGAW